MVDTPFENLSEMLIARASDDASTCAFHFLDDTGREASQMSARELLDASTAVAATLARDFAPGERAILIQPDARDFMVDFCGCLLAGLVPVPAAPPFRARAGRALPRLRSILADAGALVVLTSPDLEETAHGIFDGGARAARVMTGREHQRASPASLPGLGVDPGSAAYLQYTSGSTAAPRGVVITHRNAATYLRAMTAASPGQMDSTAVLVSWLPLFHDMGLLSSLLNALYNGYRSVVMSPLAFLLRPLTWLEAVHRYGGTGMAAPNFAFDLCVARTTPEERAGLDLSSLLAAWNGGEPIRAGTLRAFQEAFGPSGLREDAMRPCYGLAEAVLCAATNAQEVAPIHHVDLEDLRRGTYRRVDAGAVGSREVVPCGQPLPGERLEIVDPVNRRPCDAGTVGELWISSPMVAAGYWSPGVADETFGARLATEPDGPDFLRSGDLAAMSDGRLCIVGRLKDMIIIRGENYFPVDIELAAEQADRRVRAGCVVASTTGEPGEDRLLVVAEVDAATAGEEIEDVSRAIRQAVAARTGAMVARLALLPAGGVLKTSSGKVRRGGTRDALLAGELSPLAEWEGAA